MKRIRIIIFLLFGMVICTYSQEFLFDAKYVTVGVLSNEWPAQWSYNPNLRNLGTYPMSISNNRKQNAKKIAEQLYQDGVGKIVLDRLLERDSQGLHMNRLYEQAIQNTTIEEIETAIQDASAETRDVLKKEISRQLLKNNYIVIFQTVRRKLGEKTFEKKYWQVFHVEITDSIVDLAFLNWRNLQLYDQIKVPITFVAEGKVPKVKAQKFNKKASETFVGIAEDIKKVGNARVIKAENELMFDIAKKIPAFAIRGSVFKRAPFLARTNSRQGVKKGDRFYIYRFKENGSGEIYSKKVCTARATEVNEKSTRLYTISGKYASTKRGDVAVQKDRHKSSFSIMGQYSAGNDPRIGGRFQYEYLLNFSKKGMAQYFLTGIEYNKYKKEPEGVWWDGTTNICPTLHHASVMLGYGLGFNFLGRFEFMPYVMMGCQTSFMTSLENGEVWNHDDVCWDSAASSYCSCIGYAGTRFNMNLWYPLQMTLGIDYNISIGNTDKPIVRQHKLNRLNIYTGFRLHF